MELKEMADTGVWVENKEEALEYQDICSRGGWFNDDRIDSMGGYQYPALMRAFNNQYRFISKESVGKTITLAQFKERNGIMKYKEGQILVASGGVERKILGAHANLYHLSVDGGFTSAGRDLTEQELDHKGYTLKTDEPEKVEVSFKEAAAIVAKDKGVSVEELLIKD